VRVVVSNPPPLGFEVSEPTVSTPSVFVSGLQQRVDLVDSVVATVDVAGATVDVNLPVTLQPRTTTGAVASDVQLEPAIVDVLVPIAQAIFRREVAIAPRLVGQPSMGYRVLSVSVEPLTVAVVGSLEALENAGPASTELVLVSGIRSDLDNTVSAVPPLGLALEAETLVRVRVNVEAIIVQAVIDVPVEVSNVGDGLAASSQPDAVRVTLRGPAPVLAEIDDSSISVTVDAAGLEPGTFTVSVLIGFNGALEVTSVSPSDVDLTLTLSDEPSTSDGSEAGS
jgi:YbbR domain-containing protein